MTEPFPPEPWQLRGDMFVGLWLVPRQELPGWPLPAGVRPVRVGRRCALVTFWVDYRPGGTLAYRELLVALAVRDGRGPAACAVEVWVDDERSLVGGRTLWGIPKQRGDFVFGDTTPTSRAGRRGPGPGTMRARMSVGQREPVGDAGPSVMGLHQDLLPLPGRLPVRSRLVQSHPVHGVCEVPLTLSGRLRLGRARLVAEPGGPLDCLHGRRALLAASVRGFRMTVGSAEGRSR
ncbi:acetoacetate decarboxylase family protein [Streptomyces coeruleorubidus]|uniref:acetoacetate decarboxylase family protein n=1 Tax=Streptomyces coeruleorubidus TaxID=116188 RepID=UPI00237FAEDD|nr:acetoacetate decarboxylase family protein [Streptomyces coeruleorubidus]WDV56533.1 acetoacetate decarboxylase family protein [Streptomyces coeruleorubidus]